MLSPIHRRAEAHVVELRKDPVVERWITIPRERAADIDGLFPRKATPAAPVGDCPFCPISMRETEIYSVRDTDGHWKVIVVPDRRPILMSEGKTDRRARGIYDRMNGVGAHELVVETPEHRQSWSSMEPKQLEIVLQTYRRRALDLRKDSRMSAIFVAKNYGGMASKFTHPHSHVVALPIVPRALVEEVEGGESYYQYKERCVWCDIREQELSKNERTVVITDQFLVHAPFASRFPFELMLLPRKHSADFTATSDDELADLARCLRQTFEIVRERLYDASFSLILHSVPLRSTAEHSYHWHVEIRPQLSSLAGFEWGTGFYTNPIPPEVAAEHLRS